MLLFVFALLRSLLRNQWLAAIVLIFLCWVFYEPVEYFSLLSIPFLVSTFGITVILYLRLGLVAAIFGFLTYNLLMAFPISLNLSSWYAGTGIFAALAVLALAAWSFYTSLGGQKVFQRGLLEE